MKTENNHSKASRNSEYDLFWAIGDKTSSLRNWVRDKATRFNSKTPPTPYPRPPPKKGGLKISFSSVHEGIFLIPERAEIKLNLNFRGRRISRGAETAGARKLVPWKAGNRAYSTRSRGREGFPAAEPLRPHIESFDVLRRNHAVCLPHAGIQLEAPTPTPPSGLFRLGGNKTAFFRSALVTGPTDALLAVRC